MLAKTPRLWTQLVISGGKSESNIHGRQRLVHMLMIPAFSELDRSWWVFVHILSRFTDFSCNMYANDDWTVLRRVGRLNDWQIRLMLLSNTNAMISTLGGGYFMCTRALVLPWDWFLDNCCIKEESGWWGLWPKFICHSIVLSSAQPR